MIAVFFVYLLCLGLIFYRKEHLALGLLLVNFALSLFVFLSHTSFNLRF